MKKIKILFSFLFVLVICFIGTSKVYASIMPPLNGGGGGTGSGSGNKTVIHTDYVSLNNGQTMNVGDNSFFYTTPFTSTRDYDYLQIDVTKVEINSVIFIVQEYKNGYWGGEDEMEGKIKANPTNYGLWANDNSSGTLYLMFCDKDRTNYVTPTNANSANVSSMSFVTGTSEKPIKTNHSYRIAIYNPKQWNGKTAQVKANVELKVMSL